MLRHFLVIIATILWLSANGCANAPETVEVSSIDKARAFHMVKEIVEIGPRPSGSDGSRRTVEYIVARCREFGYSPEIDAWKENTPRGQLEFQNVYADLPGNKDGIIVIGSHFDTKFLPDSPRFAGANDSASSTGLLLEIMRTLKSASWRGRTIRFAFFDGEEAIVAYTETDGLYGSRRMARAIRLNKSIEDYRAMILLDMIGDADLTVTLSPDDDAELIRRVLATAEKQNVRKHFDFFLYGSIIDDHVPFKKLGIPAIDLIDFRYGPNNAYWHTEQDTLDKLSDVSLEIIGNLVIDTVIDL